MSYRPPGKQIFRFQMRREKNEEKIILQEDPQNPVLVAGDPERLHMRKVEREGGITYHINQINNLVGLVLIFLIIQNLLRYVVLYWLVYL